MSMLLNNCIFHPQMSDILQGGGRFQKCRETFQAEVLVVEKATEGRLKFPQVEQETTCMKRIFVSSIDQFRQMFNCKMLSATLLGKTS